MGSLKLFCPAKVNIFLKVTQKRENGFHELESLFALTDLFDVLEVEKSNTFEIIIDGEFSSFVDPKENLLTKIADFFAENFQLDLKLKIKLTKNIPVGSGLGGGSSDAAFFIKALNEIYRLNLSKNEMIEISLKFGSDIASFFEESPCFVFGRGEDVKKIDQKKVFHSIIIHPKKALSTKRIFDNLSGKYSQKIGFLELSKMTFDQIVKIPNDLEFSAEQQMPVIKEITLALIESGAKNAKMTGSGSACFGLFEGKEEADFAEKLLSKKLPNFFVKRVKIFC